MSDQNDANPSRTAVDLPDHVDGEFQVYVNGILQQPGADYRTDGRTILFPRVLEPEVEMTKLQLLRALLGIAGTYRKHDSVDVAYRHGGGTSSRPACPSAACHPRNARDLPGLGSSVAAGRGWWTRRIRS
jgi:hypothetical protein